jgi:hypothetical protein
MSISGVPATTSDGRHHPSCDPGAGEYTDQEDRRAHCDAHRRDRQQFGPPYANFTEMIIAVPLAVARPSNTMMSVLTSTILPPRP